MTDTTNNIVLVAPRQRWWAVGLAVISLLVLSAVTVAVIIPAQTFARADNPFRDEVEPAPFARIPASTESVNDRVVYNDLPDDVDVYETDGDFFFVTVSAPDQSVLSWLIGQTEEVVDPLTPEGKFGNLTPTQNRQISLQQMRTATQEAQYVALLAAGYEPTIERGEVVVEEVLCLVPSIGSPDCEERFPADEQLDPADTILEVAGVPVSTLDELSAELDGLAPGDTVDLKIRRPEVGELDVTVELSASPDEPDRTLIGFRPFDTATVALPFDVSIDSGAIGGPSAGLAFTLALIDELTVGELTGGRNVAVTGTIDLEGNVGPIGGLKQKVSAVKQHGVEVFLIPASQFELGDPAPDEEPGSVCRWECLNEVAGGDVVLVPVANLGEALEALRLLGGDPLVPVGQEPA
ncbi:MAG: S16 family serine protease [Ilumatobacter sp.]|uniref:S16 family serine protease n=1 Tax=Ilumatobacter sp. TaxID=1967498 RepID=UPI00391BD634